MKRIYFAGSIRGGRHNRDVYLKIIRHLQLFGEVLTEHIGDENIIPINEVSQSDFEIYTRDIAWLTSCEIFIADVTVPSLGVGFEIAKAIELNKKILCLYHLQANNKLSAMISGCPDIRVFEYHTLEEVKIIINEFMLY